MFNADGGTGRHNEANIRLSPKKEDRRIVCKGCSDLSIDGKSAL